MPKRVSKTPRDYVEDALRESIRVLKGCDPGKPPAKEVAEGILAMATFLQDDEERGDRLDRLEKALKLAAARIEEIGNLALHNRQEITARQKRVERRQRGGAV